MSIVLFEVGAYVLLAKHIQLNKGVWQFHRRIPDDLAKHYPGKKGKIRFSLKTKDERVAAKLAHQHAIQQDALWKSLRSGEINYGPEAIHAAMAILERFKLTPGEWEAWNATGLEPDEFIRELEYQADIDPMVSREVNAHRMQHGMPLPYRMAADLFYGTKAPLFMSEALKQFQQLKGEKPDTKSAKDRCRVVQDFTTLFGDLREAQG